MQERLPELAAFAGRTAGWLHGLDFDPCSPIEVVAAPAARVSARAGAMLRRAEVTQSEIVEISGFRATSPMRTVLDLAARLPLVEAVVAVDMALQAGLITRPDLSSAVEGLAGRKGAAQCRKVLALADGRAESPMETRLRLLLVLAGLPAPECQVPMYSADGIFLGRPDLYYPDHQLAVEFDGGVHRDQLVDDNRRQNLLIGAGIRLLRFTSADVYARPQTVIAQVSQAIGTPAIRRRMARRDAKNQAIGRRMARRELAS